VFYVKATKGQAEATRRKLIALGVFDSGRAVEREDNHVFFPVSSKLDGFEVVEREGTQVARKPRSLHEVLEHRLSDDELRHLPSSFNVVGDIAVLELDDTLLPKKGLIGSALVETFPNIKVACLKTRQVGGDFRVPGVQVMAGEGRTETVHREHGLYYKLDVAKAYFSPRLSGERMRVIRQIEDGERILVMFAGVGPYAVLAASLKKVKVTAVELNPDAVEYMRWNVLRNKVKVEVVEGDVRDATPRLGEFDRIIMPLPKEADTFLDVALPALSRGGVIHYYTFAGNTLAATGYLAETLANLGVRPDILEAVVCGSYSPSLNRICADFRVVAP
jgi:tRNA (guanine37-N1)-methyltransferase